MDNPAKEFKIKLNQNLWLLVVALLGLGFSEFFGLPWLMKISILLSIFSLLSNILTFTFYTIKYIKERLIDIKDLDRKLSDKDN